MLLLNHLSGEILVMKFNIGDNPSPNAIYPPPKKTNAGIITLCNKVDQLSVSLNNIETIVPIPTTIIIKGIIAIGSTSKFSP